MIDFNFREEYDCSSFSCKRFGGAIVLTFCNHPDNPDDSEGNCYAEICPKNKRRKTLLPKSNNETKGEQK